MVVIKYNREKNKSDIRLKKDSYPFYALKNNSNYTESIQLIKNEIQFFEEYIKKLKEKLEKTEEKKVSFNGRE
jgi:hypothetical protein